MSGNQMILLGGSQAPAVDPFFYSVTSLLHGDGTNGAQNNTFLDSSTNNFTITRNGNTTQGSFSPFSQTGWSWYFDGTGDTLSWSGTTLSGDFTVECWVYKTAVDGSGYTNVFSSSSANNQLYFDNTTAGSIGLAIGASTIIAPSGTAVTPNVWHHLAWVRQGSTCRAYVDGVQQGTGTSSASFNLSLIAQFQAGGYEMNGYISNARIVSGTCLYPSGTTFTPPTTPLTAISGTQLLTCQANRFLDASSNAFAITRNGDVSVQPFSPFNPTTPYSTSAVGGSGYFDGSGDYLSVASSSAFNFGAGDFTIEFWLYPTATQNAFAGIVVQGTDSDPSWFVHYDSGGSLLRLTNWSANILVSSVSPPRNTWTHYAFVRNGGGTNNTKLYVNGVLDAQTTFTSSLGQTSTTIVGGGYNGGGRPSFTGFIGGLRIVTGTAVYTAAFTPPTAPLTAIANTSLLANFTNAGIFDNAAVADYETVGNAQISTSVKKYGTGSMAFDGTGDYLPTASNQNFAFRTGDFTVEYWIYTNSSADDGIFQLSTTAGGFATSYTNGMMMAVVSGVLYYALGGSSASTGFTINNSTWYHIAMCRTSGVVKVFVNGTQVASAANTTDVTATNLVIGGYYSTSYTLVGYIDDFRISNGIGRYPYNFTPPTAEFPNIGGTVTLTADPFYEYTTLLLPGNGTNGAQNNTFLDSSTNNFTITRNGNTTQGTFSPFSQTGWGNYFDGTGDALTLPSNSALALGSGNFTVEAWVYNQNGANLYPDIFSNSGNIIAFILNDRSSIYRTILSDDNYPGSGNATLLSATGTIGQNAWAHVAWVRSGSTITVYINGTASGTVTSSTNHTVELQVIGAIAQGAGPSLYFWNGYISNLRLVKGTAVYTANFTPPTTPLTAITNTSLLTCQANRFLDASSNAFAITRNGDVSVQAFSPFNPTAAWSAATNGGSGYFDGSGDYLTVPDNAAFDFGSGDFTISAWIYPQGAGAVIDQGGGGASSNRSFEIYMSSASSISNAYISSDGTYQAGYNLTGTTVPNAWNFIEFTRASGTLRLFVNGVQQSSVSANVTIFNSTATVAIGNTSENAVNPFTGYISSVRVLKGTGSATSTVPTAPLTAISNTQLLTNFTNAGIYDATSKNDLETVGNAQISTTQSKFGGSSMYFDGTGDWLRAPSGPITSLEGDFTAEGWVYLSSTAAAWPVFTVGDSNGSTGIELYRATSNGKWRVLSNNTAQIDSTTSTSTGSWVHLAVTRYSGVVRLFVNGINEGSTWSTTGTFSGAVYVGAEFYGGSVTVAANGYIQDLRITKGIARYTSNFTPPTTAFLTL